MLDPDVEHLGDSVFAQRTMRAEAKLGYALVESENLSATPSSCSGLKSSIKVRL
jgi:hypothetical protein